MNPLKLKTDAFRAARGGRSRRYTIRCRKCSTKICIYQKDGPGSLRRMYLDRILAPRAIAGRKSLPLDSIPPLRCKGCKETLGMPIIYAKERRKAYRLYVDAVVKS